MKTGGHLGRSHKVTKHQSNRVRGCIRQKRLTNSRLNSRATVKRITRMSHDTKNTRLGGGGGENSYPKSASSDGGVETLQKREKKRGNGIEFRRETQGGKKLKVEKTS